ncbi:hypothetical protein WG66_007305, partial [Moniliophthora roreri]
MTDLARKKSTGPALNFPALLSFFSTTIVASCFPTTTISSFPCQVINFPATITRKYCELRVKSGLVWVSLVGLAFDLVKTQDEGPPIKTDEEIHRHQVRFSVVLLYRAERYHNTATSEASQMVNFKPLLSAYPIFLTVKRIRCIVQDSDMANGWGE